MIFLIYRKFLFLGENILSFLSSHLEETPNSLVFILNMYANAKKINRRKLILELHYESLYFHPYLSLHHLLKNICFNNVSRLDSGGTYL